LQGWRRRGFGRLAACALAGGCLPAGVRAAAFGGGFSLTDGAGRTVTSRDFRGAFVLLMFGYTHCPDLCPTMLYTMVQALRQMGGAAAKVQPIFITVDPARDSPAEVGRYVALFSPRIIGLSGSKAAITRAEQAYDVYVGPADPRSGAISHSALLYVIAPDGSFLTALNGRLDADDLAAALGEIVGGDSGIVAQPADGMSDPPPY